MIALIAALALGLVVMAYGLRRLVRERNAIAAHRAQLAEDLKASRIAYQAIYDVLDPFNGFGGVHKRIDEIREVTEAVRDNRPELFQEVVGLVDWLDANDQFLCCLRDTAVPEGSSSQHDEQHAFWRGTGRTNRIYDDVRLELNAARSTYKEPRNGNGEHIHF